MFVYIRICKNGAKKQKRQISKYKYKEMMANRRKNGRNNRKTGKENEENNKWMERNTNKKEQGRAGKKVNIKLKIFLRIVVNIKHQQYHRLVGPRNLLITNGYTPLSATNREHAATNREHWCDTLGTSWRQIGNK